MSDTHTSGPRARLIASLTQEPSPSGDLHADVTAFLNQHGYPKTAAHCTAVGAVAGQLAARFGLAATAATQAGWLHDVSAVIPNAERIVAAEAFELEVLPEERQLPMILHQKLSAVLASEIFGVHDPAVLSAIACHTTLKAQASELDMLVFVADKIAWDQAGTPPYFEALNTALEESLSAAALVYLEYMWGQRAELKVLHPWLAEAYQELSRQS